MENMMRSMAQLLIDNAQSRFDLPAECVELILKPQASGEDEERRRTITLRELRTVDSVADTAMSNASAEWPGEVEWFLTVFEVIVTCRAPAAKRDRDYYPNEARRLANQVRAFLRGRGGTGRIIDRHVWDEETGADIGIQGAGVAKWQRTDQQPRDDEDPAYTYVLTYELKWWAPAPADD